MVSVSLADRMARIEMLVLDVDGVLADGRITYTDDGREIKSFHVRDGAGLNYWAKAGRQAAIISGRSTPAVTRRAAELGITHLYQGAASKLPALIELLRVTGKPPESVCVIGDDLPDLPLLRNAGLGIAVADACADLRATAHYVTLLPGGRGAVREVIEMLLQRQGLWQSLLDRLHAERI